MNLLGGISRSDFLNTHWQKKPLLIRQAMPDYVSPISAEELAGLACEEGVESRIVLEQSNNGPWSVQHGPFNEDDFTNLPETNWSLLVQSVNHHVPAIAALLEQFDFIANWRVDDIMISFAPVHGSVGPHLDNYDVFLLQAQGQRHWHINETSYSEKDFIEGLDLRIINDFKATKDWVLEPGDMLYLPPGVAHHGVALNDCLTFSIGFRSPTRQELIEAYLTHMQETNQDEYYSDPDLSVQGYPGEIKTEQLNAIQNHMTSPLIQNSDFNSWFGRYITDSHGLLEDYKNIELTFDDFVVAFKQSSRLVRHGFIRMSYIEQDNDVRFFFAGYELCFTKDDLPLARYLSSHHQVDYFEFCELYNDEKSEMALNLLFKLFKEGCYDFDESD